MADKYINQVGVQTIRDWANRKFALDADLDALDTKVDGIISEGGEPNTIESISVNGTPVAPDAQKNVALTVPTATSDLTNDSNFAVDANYVHTDNNYTTAEKTKLEGVETGAEANVIETVKVNGTALTPDAQKAVDVTVPTKVSDLTNDGDGTTGSRFATETYVDQNGGKIDKIKVNGTEQTITNKAVDITVPTKVSDLTNDGDGTSGSEFATKSYVDQNGGKIDVIKVNGTAQTITNKEVDLAVPTAVSDLTNDSNFQTDTQVDAKIASAVASAVTLKGSVATYTDLPSTGQKHGDLYDVLDTGRNYVWLVENGTGRWDDYAGTIDLSAYWISTPGQTNTLEAMTVAEINAILEPSA